MSRSLKSTCLHLLALLLLAAVPGAAAPAPAKKDKPLKEKGIDYSKDQKRRIEELAPAYRDWLHVVEALISAEEVEAFLALEKDYQRDAFIDRFWRSRDQFADTATNEFKERWLERAASARQLFGAIDNEPSKLYMLNGEPTVRLDEPRCSRLKPIMIWFYDGSDQVFFEFFLIFYRESASSHWRLWDPSLGLDRILDNWSAQNDPGLDDSFGGPIAHVRRTCRDGDVIATAIAWVLNEGIDYGALVARMEKRPEGREAEWVATFNSYSTDVEEGAAKLPAALQIEFPGRRQSRTLVQGLLEVPRETVATAELGEHRSYNFVLNGEVLQDDKLFDNFRYKFDLPLARAPNPEASDAPAEGEPAEAPASVDGPIPLVFERYLRPGDYRLILKLEDINGKAFYREERALSVPKVETNAPPPPEDAFSRRLLAEANAALSTGETTVRIVEPMSEILTGFHRFETLTTGPDIAKVEFSLDGRSVLVKRRAPYSVELDLGQVPRARTLVVTAFDAAGAEVARDEMLLNAGGSRFSVELVEPRKGRTYADSLRAEVQVEVPEGKVAQRVELFLNETRVATLYQEPWTQTILLPDDEYLAYVRAVAYLPDGNSTEDLVFVNAPDYLEEVDVQFVELYAAVLDRDNRPIGGLTQAAFTPVEDGVPQQIARFEVVDNLPIHAGILLDVSASMEGSLEETQAAALQFLEEAIEPKDRATLVTFNDRPNLKVKFTNDVTELAGGLAGLKAERGTSLYDSLIFSLYYFNGVKGQKALLVLSDGKDESSKYSYEDALEYARRAGVTVYSIALRDDQAHRKLSKIAEETGGRAFFVDAPSQLAGVYEAIQRELRSRYLVAYQSSNATDSQDFRTVELKVDRPGAEAKTLRGYYP